MSKYVNWTDVVRNDHHDINLRKLKKGMWLENDYVKYYMMFDDYIVYLDEDGMGYAKMKLGETPIWDSWDVITKEELKQVMSTRNTPLYKAVYSVNPEGVY